MSKCAATGWLKRVNAADKKQTKPEFECALNCLVADNSGYVVALNATALSKLLNAVSGFCFRSDVSRRLPQVLSKFVVVNIGNCAAAVTDSVSKDLLEPCTAICTVYPGLLTTPSCDEAKLCANAVMNHLASQLTSTSILQPLLCKTIQISSAHKFLQTLK